VSRIYLDNFDHLTAYWVGLGMKLAQVALNYGADDLHGTIIEEHIFHMAGATSPQLQTEAEMIKAIRETGRVPVQRNTFYEPIRIIESVPSVPGTKNNANVLEDDLVAK
jgi:aminodeoxyfutalosine synthase